MLREENCRLKMRVKSADFDILGGHGYWPLANTPCEAAYLRRYTALHTAAYLKIHIFFISLLNAVLFWDLRELDAGSLAKTVEPSYFQTQM